MNALDTLVNAVTSFSTWAEFKASMNNGYLPTIYPNSRRKRILRKVLAASKFQAWPKIK